MAFDNKNPADPLIKYLTIGRQLGYAGYLVIDNLTVLDLLGVVKLNNVKSYSEKAARAWMSGLICSAVAGVYTLWKLNESAKAVNKKEGEGVVEAKKIEKYVSYLSIFYFSLF